MEVTILGSGASILSPDRVLSGLMIETAGEPLLFDIGAGVLHRLSCSLSDPTKIEHVFISHFHVDHCSDLVAFFQSLWLMGYNKILNLYGSKHLKKVIKSISEIFPYLNGKVRTKIHTIKPGFKVNTDKWTVIAFPVEHGDIETYGFIMEAEGKRVVYSADTAPCQALIEAAKNADMLIHECSLPDRMKDMAPNHTTPGDLGKLAAEAKVKTLVLTHMYPDLLEELSEALRSIRASYSGKVIVPRDTQIVTL